jgi:hypothetical protein
MDERSRGMACGEPRWLLTLSYALVMTALVCVPAWPGQMNYDGLYAWRSSIEGIDTAVWPPMHAYLFWLSRAAGLGAGGLFAVQTFLIFAGAALSASLLLSSRRLLAAALAGFALLCVVIAPMWGVMLVHWRDVTTASFAMLGLSLWLLAARYRALALVVCAALAIGLAASLRYNAFALFAGLLPLMVWKPLPGAPAGVRARIFAAVALAVAFGLAWASIQWRLPDLQRLRPASTATNIQVFDLLGVSACEGRSRLPLEVTRGQPLNGDQVRRLYDPRHLQLAFGPHPGIPQIFATQKYQTPQMRTDVARAWGAALRERPDCYVRHRTAVAVEQMGLAPAGVFYPTHGRIDPNPYGLALAHPAASQAVTAYVWQASQRWWSRPAWLYLAAAAVLAALALRRDLRALAAGALLAGALANEAVLYLVAPATDARYIFPGDVFCAFVVAAGLAMLAEGRGGRHAG